MVVNLIWYKRFTKFSLCLFNLETWHGRKKFCGLFCVCVSQMILLVGRDIRRLHKFQLGRKWSVFNHLICSASSIIERQMGFKKDQSSHTFHQITKLFFSPHFPSLISLFRPAFSSVSWMTDLWLGLEMNAVVSVEFDGFFSKKNFTM